MHKGILAELDMSVDEAHALLTAFRVFAEGLLAAVYMGTTLTYGVSIGDGVLRLECHSKRKLNLEAKSRVKVAAAAFVAGWKSYRDTSKGE